MVSFWTLARVSTITTPVIVVVNFTLAWKKGIMVTPVAKLMKLHECLGLCWIIGGRGSRDSSWSPATIFLLQSSVKGLRKVPTPIIGKVQFRCLTVGSLPRMTSTCFFNKYVPANFLQGLPLLYERSDVVERVAETIPKTRYLTCF